MIGLKRTFVAVAVATGLLSAAPAAMASDYPMGLVGLSLIGPYGYQAPGYVDAYYAPAWSGTHYRRGYAYPYYGYYHRRPIYGTTYAAPSYVDEDCRIHDEPTPYGWRTYRVCR